MHHDFIFVERGKESWSSVTRRSLRWGNGSYNSQRSSPIERKALWIICHGQLRRNRDVFRLHEIVTGKQTEGIVYRDVEAATGDCFKQQSAPLCDGKNVWSAVIAAFFWQGKSVVVSAGPGALRWMMKLTEERTWPLFAVWWTRSGGSCFLIRCIPWQLSKAKLWSS